MHLDGISGAAGAQAAGDVGKSGTDHLEVERDRIEVEDRRHRGAGDLTGPTPSPSVRDRAGHAVDGQLDEDPIDPEHDDPHAWPLACGDHPLKGQGELPVLGA